MHVHKEAERNILPASAISSSSFVINLISFIWAEKMLKKGKNRASWINWKASQGKANNERYIHDVSKLKA